MAIGSTSTCAPSFSRKANILKLPSPSVVCAQNSPVILMTGFTRRRSTSMALMLSRQACRASTYSLPYRLWAIFPRVQPMPFDLLMFFDIGLGPGGSRLHDVPAFAVAQRIGQRFD